MLAAKGATGVRLSCQIICDHDMTVRAISRLDRQRPAGSGAHTGADDHAAAGVGVKEMGRADGNQHARFHSVPVPSPIARLGAA